MNKDRFVNPYAFVPLPVRINRGPAPGHGYRPGRLNATIEVSWTLRTPMLLPAGAKAQGWIEPDGAIRIPGSAIKGAVRALHEAMFKGCLSTLDADFLPGYRDPASSADADDWSLALVTDSNRGFPTRMRLCTDVVWVDARSLRDQWRQPTLPTSGDIATVTSVGGALCSGDNDTLPTSGDIATVTGPIESSTLGRREMRVVTGAQKLGSVDLDGELPSRARLILVTDPRVRPKERRDRTPAQWFWATGELGTRVLCLSEDDPDDRAAVARYRRAAAGSDDLRRLTAKKGRTRPGAAPAIDWRQAAVPEVVQDPTKRPLARRALTTGLLHRGQAVWVKVIDDRVVDFKAAQIWRHTGQGSVRDRLSDPSLLQCESTPQIAGSQASGSPNPQLCPACTTFGTVGRSARGGKREREMAARPYAGHVRFSSAVSSDPVSLTSIDVAPMGAPRPGSGNFYLDLPAAPDPDLNQIPSQWGVTGTRERIKGRKFYWHSDPVQQARTWQAQGVRITPRHLASAVAVAGSPEQLARPEPGMTRKADLVPAGTTFTATIRATNVTPIMLKLLLAAVDPGDYLQSQTRRPGAAYAVHLGGGRPLGLGSATVTARLVDIDEARSRYVAGSEPKDTDEQETRLRTWGPAERVDPGSEALARLLDLNGLGDWAANVHYPPGTTWDGARERVFRESFRFFQLANGQQLQRGSRAWHRLPTVTAENDVTLPIEKPRTRR